MSLRTRCSSPSIANTYAGKRNYAHGCPDHELSHASSLIRSSRQARRRTKVSSLTEEAVNGAVSTIPQAHWTALAPSTFIHDNRAFVEQHRIRGYEVGPDQRTTMVTIANILQEVASNHAVAMWGRSSEGFATDPALADRGLIFVATRMQVAMDEYPKWGDVVEVKTWFQGSGKIGAQRDWFVRDAVTGRNLGRATSSWVMINMNTRRLSKLPDEMRERMSCFQMLPEAHAFPENSTRLKIPDIDISSEGVIIGPKQVARRSDMDMNGHINNVTYLAWAIESVPLEVHERAHLCQIEVDFKAECHAGEVIEGIACPTTTTETLASNGSGKDSQTFLHMLRRCEEGKGCTELVKGRTTWRL